MYYDEETNLWYSQKQDAEQVKLWSRINRGEIRLIQGFSRYAMLEDGTVMNVNRALPVSQRTNGHRLMISLVNDEGQQKSMSLGRLVAQHFIPLPDDGQYYDVEFDDGNVLNVHPDNLHWKPRYKRLVDPNNYSPYINL